MPSFFRMLHIWCLPALLFGVLGLSTVLCSQTVASGNLTGTVTDPSGAIVAGAHIALTSARGIEKVATSSGQGTYEFRGVEQGTYTLTVEFAGFAIYRKENISVSGGQSQRMNVQLRVAGVKEDVEVGGEEAQVSVNAEDNVGAVTIGQKEIDALSDDPDELEAELLALAGPSVGPNGGQIYVDGFTVDEGLPPKNTIRQIRVNQNPFSAQYDRLGYGRIEIVTKPGGNKLHGRVTLSGNDMVFDTRAPFAQGNSSYHSFLSLADLNGPIGKKASYFLNYQYRNLVNDAVVNALTLDSNNKQGQLLQTVSAPNTLNTGGPRLDYAITPNNYLMVSYSYTLQNEGNLGVGGFFEATQGYSLRSSQNMVRASDTQIVGSHFMNVFSAQTQQQHYVETPVSKAMEISVAGAFTSGGSTQGDLDYRHHHFEFNELATYTLTKHTLNFGGRLRTVTEPYSSPTNFNGTFLFTSLSQLAAQTPKQFTIAVGNPFKRIYSDDGGLFITDDWRVRSNVLISSGLRFETQNYIRNKADWAPRVALAWGLRRRSEQTAKTVLRAGFGIFFDRFSQQMQLEDELLNGVIQTQYLITNPTSAFYNQAIAQRPSLSTLLANGAVTTVYKINPTVHAPYTMQAAIGAERQISRSITLSATYLSSRGLHQFISNNENAPLPGTYNYLAANSGTRPIPNQGNIYEYESAAVFNQNQLITNFSVRASRRVSLFGFYSFSHANSDTGGVGTFPSNPYNISQDYGRAAFDIQDRASVGGTLQLKYGVTLSPLTYFQSGTPFNYVTPLDLVGSTIYNQRPAFATSSTPLANTVSTSLGSFNIAPSPMDPLVPVNYGTGPKNFVMNLRATKSIVLGRSSSERAAATDTGIATGGSTGFGLKTAGSNNQASGGGSLGNRGLGGEGGDSGSGGGSKSHYTLSLAAEARNIFNDANLAPPIGNVSSSLFGTSNSAAGGVYSFSGTNRRIDFQVVFAF